MKRDIIVVGGSAGGIRALRSLMSKLPSDLPATMLAVLHSSPRSPRLLPEIFSERGKIPTRYGSDCEIARQSHLYVAPPDCHMLIDPAGHIRLTHGPKENRFRPAIDPLFRSAALAYGPRVIGILLSGGMDDGVAGLAAIKSMGGLVVVQDPQEAEVPAMPRNALRRVDVDHSLPVAEISQLIERSSRAAAETDILPRDDFMISQKTLEVEVRLAHERQSASSEDLLQLGSPSMVTCPECHGTLLRINDEKLLRFRCHTGHAFTAEILLLALNERTEEALWNAIRVFEESAMLLGHMVKHFPEDAPEIADTFRASAKDARDRAAAVRNILTLPAQVTAVHEATKRG